MCNTSKQNLLENYKMKILCKAVLFIFCVIWLVVSPPLVRSVFAQALLRDTETEMFLRDISTPFFKSAGLEPNAVQMYLLQENSINAFVAGGQNIFIFSGLIQQARSVNELEGVIAHETGHIAGGHIARTDEATRPALAIMLASVLLGLGAAVAGSPDAAAGLLIGGQTMAQRSFLAYTRVQESAADQAALTFLNSAHVSAEGLISFFDRLRDEELLRVSRRDPYARTHPLSGDRMQALADRAKKSTAWGQPSDKTKEYRFRRIQAKIDGFALEPAVTLRKYPEYNHDEISRYARVYAYHKELEFDKALTEAKSLLAETPDDPFYQEIAGQILFEQGKAADSIPYFEHAISLLPHEPLLLTLLGNSLVAVNTPENNLRALEVLQQAVLLDKFNDLGWHQLSVIYARLGNMKMANLATAELFVIQGRYPEAIHRSATAQCFMKEGTREWLQAEDVIISARALMRDDPRYKNTDDRSEGRRQNQGEKWDIKSGKPPCSVGSGRIN